ncbi:MAG: hypothetical protein J7577_18060 [Sphingobacteriaceae bacterium]|nr:hypothetical protein [Sphingobacteriaceae bacterium]
MKKTDLEIEFEAKLKDYKLLIYKVCRMYVNNHDDIQDLYHDIIIQLWKSYPKFRGLIPPAVKAKLTDILY